MANATILIIDPNETHRKNIDHILRLEGYATTVMSDARTALSWMSVNVPDLVILDELVKGLTPKDLLNRCHQQDMDTFVIITSDEPDFDRGARWTLRGAFAYLPKPIRQDTLKQVIEKGLENKEAYHQVVTMARDLAETNGALEQEKAALHEKSEQLRFLVDLGAQLSATLNTSEIVAIVYGAIRRLIQANLAIFFLGDVEAEGGVQIFSNRPLSEEWFRMAAEAAAPGSALSYQDMAGRINVLESHAPGRPPLIQPTERLVFPLMVAGRRIGALAVYVRHLSQINADQTMLLESLAVQASQAFLNAQQYETALDRAARDFLTGLFNRRTFDENLQREFDRSVRYQSDLSLILIDLDHFKSVNDRFGHQVGDEVLQSVARVIGDTIRTTDMAARIGGEEFAVILPNTNQDKAVRLARRIQRNLRRPAHIIGDIWLEQTVSQGVADIRSFEIKGVEELILLADKSMYMAKEEGRNTICTATEWVAVHPGKADQYAWL